MKLDPRIKSVSDILTPYDTEKAEQFIGQKGFFANSIDYFREGTPFCRYGTLINVLDDQTISPYLKGRHDGYLFFLPESSLKPEENDEAEKLLDGQKLIADTISVALSKEEIELLIEGLCDMSITDKRALNMYQKLAGKLEALEGARGKEDEEGEPR